MATAIHVLFFAWLALGVLAFFLFKAADRPADDFGAVFPAIGVAALAVLCFLVWLVLLVARAW